MAILILKQGLDSETGSLAYAEPIFHTTSNTIVISGSDNRTYRVALVDKINTGSIHTTGDFSGSNLLLDGNATIRGNITMGGSGLDFGDDATDNIVFKADISSSIVPDSSNSFNLGSDGQRWNDLYVSGAISASGGHFDFDSDTFIDLNAASRFDVDAGGILSLDSTNSITIGTAQDVPIDIDASTFDVDASSTITLDANRFNIGHVGDAPMDIEVSTLNIGASGYLHLSSSATLDVDATGAITINGESTTAISSSGALSIDSETGINIGTTTDKPIDIDASTLDIDASGNITINGEGSTAISSSGALSIDSETGINIGTTTDKPIVVDSTTFDLDATGAITVDSTSTISLDGVGNSNFTTDAGNLTINNTTSGNMTVQSAGAIDIDADGGKITIDGSSGIDIGVESDVAIDIDASTLDIDASGALNIDSATSISIGTTADKPIDIDSTTLDIDASGAITIDGTSTLSIDVDGATNINTSVGNITIDSEAGSISVDGHTGVEVTSTNSGNVTIDGKEGITIQEDGTDVIVVDTNRDVLFSQTGGSEADPDVEISGYFKASAASTLVGAVTAKSTISASADITTTGLNAGNINVGITGDNEIDTDSGNLTIDSAGGTVTIDDNTIITGDLTVTGTRTFTNTTTLDVADNIININYGGASVLAGIYANDATAPNVLSGSILWNGTTDRWIAGQSGSEQTLLLDDGDSIISGSGVNNQVTLFNSTHGVDSSANLTFASDVLRVNGRTEITGDLSGSLSGSFKAVTVTDIDSDRVVVAGTNGELEGDGNLRWNGTGLLVDGSVEATVSGSFKDLKVTDNVTIDGVVRAEQLKITGSENILATFISTDESAKVVIKDSEGQGTTISYNGTADTAGFGQSSTHNHLAIHVNDNERVAIGKNHTIPNAVLDVSGSLIVSGTLETTDDVSGSASGSFKDVKVTDNATIDGVVRAEQLNVTSSENILATFISTDAAAKIVLKDVDGEGARLSYVGTDDTVGLGQSNSHNHMAIHIDNNERVAIGSNHTIPNAVLDVSGSMIVSGTLESTTITATSASFGRMVGSIGATNGVVSGSSQIDHDTTTNFVANEHIDHSSVSVTAGSGISGGGTIEATRTLTLDTGSNQFTEGITEVLNDLEVQSGSMSTETLQSVTNNGATSSAQITFTNTTDSTAKTNGSIVISGGMGVNNTINVGGDVIAFASSDKRLKENIKPIANALDKVCKISGNTFDWNEEKQNTYKGRDYGVVAQEIKEVMPELVDTRDNGYLAVKYDKIVPLLIESIKELKKEIEELKSK
tara:strand:+ start:14922 stop:18779 length:3858 start_codon:yes stop_codon:yes gene_type:complete